MINKFLVIMLTLLGSVGVARAQDRSQSVRTRLNSALSGILSSTDYMVIVRKSDESQEVVNESSSATLRALPGLSAAVDTQGRPVKTGSASYYAGPVAITVVFDANVKADTVEAFKNLIPDIMGRSDDRDAIKISRAVLRQPPVAAEKAPTLVVQNMGNKTPDEGALGMANLVKIFSLILISTGLLTWLFGRRESGSKSSPPMSPAKSELPKEDSVPVAVEESMQGALASFDPRMLGLYLLKVLHQNERNKFKAITDEAPLSLQRKVLSTLPTWISKYLLDQWKVSSGTSDATGGNSETTIEPASVIRELSLLEKDLAGDALAVAKLFLEFFPVSALQTALQHGAELDPNLAMRLWLVRPDVVACIKMDDVDPGQAPDKLSDDDLRDCYEGLWALKTSSVLQVSFPKEELKISRWSALLNALDTFEDVRTQWEKLKASMVGDELQRLESKVVSWESLKGLSGSMLKDFLRRIDSRDLAWVMTEAGADLKWDLAALMRPLRFKMYQQLMQEKIEFTDEERRQASKRVLALLRECSKEQMNVAA